MCEDDWVSRNPRRVPVRMVDPDEEVCAWCGKTTYSGIYVRADPATVPYPRQDVKEDDHGEQ